MLLSRRCPKLVDTREELVRRFVAACFAPLGADTRAPLLHNVTREEVRTAILKILAVEGRFPLTADMIEDNPTIYLGEQIRALPDGRYVAANVNAPRASDAAPLREFDNATQAVDFFMRARIHDWLRGVPIT